MWTVVFMTQCEDSLYDMQKSLVNEGILVKVRTSAKPKDESERLFEVLVMEAEAEEAHQVILGKRY